MEKLLTVKEVANVLGIERATIYDWIYRRKIEFVKIGRLVRFKPKTIEELINNNTK